MKDKESGHFASVLRKDSFFDIMQADMRMFETTADIDKPCENWNKIKEWGMKKIRVIIVTN